MTSIAGTYDHRLVALSVAIAILASYAALDLAGRVTASQGRARLAWLSGGALAMGSGIWSMHYTGMLAYRLPMRVYYHVPTVALSLVAAWFSSLIALYVVSREPVTKLHVGGGSLLMGAGIAVMHYTGMAAMRQAAMHHYDRGLWVLSVVLAVVISFVGLLLISFCRHEDRGGKLKVGIAVVMGLAIPVMHYSGMAAVRFTPMEVAPDLSFSVDISAVASFAIVMVVFLIIGLALVTSLIDRRLSAQHAVLDTERQMLRALIDNIPDFMYVKDAESRFVVANRQLAHTAGVETPEQLLGKTDFDFFPRHLAEAYHADEQRLLASGQVLFNREEESVDSAGNETHILTTKVPLRDAKGKVIGVAGVGRDISERKRMEDALREAERKYRGIFDQATVGIFQSTPDGRLLSANPAMARTFGYASPEEMIAGIADMERQYVHPKRREELVLMMERMGTVQNFECEMLRKDDTKIWLNLSLRAVQEDGVIVRYEGMNEDITERKLLRDQLLQAQKLESVGQLASGIAHEINTPAQYIGDNVRFLKDAFADLTSLLTDYRRLLASAKEGGVLNELVQEVAGAVERADEPYLLAEIPKALEQTLEGITRVSTLVSAMKEFSHPGVKEKIPLDLNRAIESTITIARNEWKYVADLESEYDRSLPAVSCLPGEFNQVILNLIVNAAHAIGDVSARNGVSGKGEIKVQTQNCPDWVEIRIQDNGSGIPEQVRSRVFDPFFTTKEIGKGTGQGLAIARSVVVDKHGGSIHFETEEGRGTTFIIRLPHDGKSVASQAVPA